MVQRPETIVKPLAAGEVARRSPTSGVQFRADPFRLRVSFDDVRCAGGDDLDLVFECSARIADGRSDRVMFEEIFLGDNRECVTNAEVVAHLSRQALPQIATTVCTRSAEDWLAPTNRAELTDAVAARIDAAAFACGLSTLAPFVLNIRSDSVERRQAEKDDRTRADAQRAEQADHLRHAGELLKEFQRLRNDAGDEAAGQVLRQVAPADRGAMLNATLFANASSAVKTIVWAVAGNALVRIDASVDQPTTNVIELPQTLGPLRSVQRGEIDNKPVLLVGAQGGIWCVSREKPGDARAFTAPTITSAFGFNAAIADGDTLLATHAEHGLIAWTTNNPTPRIVAAKSGARLVTKLSSNRIAFVAKDGATSTLFVVQFDGTVLPIDEGATLPRDAVALTVDARRIFATLDDGTIRVFDRQSLRLLPSIARPAGRVLTASALPWLGSIRILTARDDGAIECFGPDDQLITQFVSAHRGPKIVAANTDTIAAVSTDRQRLILWHAWDGRAPFAELHLATLTRHRIADIDVA